MSTGVIYSPTTGRAVTTTEVDGKTYLDVNAEVTGDVNVDSTSVDTSGYIGKASGTNGDFVTAYASGTTITLSSLPTGVSAIGADDIITIVQLNTSGAVVETYSRDDVTITAAGTDPTTLTVTGATFAATDTFVVYTNIGKPAGGGTYNATEPTLTDGESTSTQFDNKGYTKVVSKAYDSLTQADKSAEVNPLNRQYVAQSNTLTTVLNATPQYIYYDMSGHDIITIQVAAVDAGGGDTHSITLEGTCQDDGTAQASCTYTDVTADLTDGALTAAGIWIINTPVAFKYLRVKDTTAGGNNDGGITVYAKKLY